MIFIRSKSDVQELLQRRTLPRDRSLFLVLPGLDPASRARLENRLNKYAHECGCSLGGLFASSGIVVASFFWIQSFGLSVRNVAALLPRAVAAVFVLGVVGKTVGIAIARTRLRRELRRLLQEHAAYT